MKNPLIWLHKLVNVDKHRYLHLTVGGVTGFGFGSPPGVEVSSHWFRGIGPLEPGEDLLRVRYREVPANGGDLGSVSLPLGAFLAAPVVAVTGLPLTRLPVLGTVRLILGATREAIHHISGGDSVPPFGISKLRSG